MKERKRRKNGTGTVAFLGKGRYKPYAARLLVGRDFEGKPIYYDIDTFEDELDALVCLETWKKELRPLKIKKSKYNRITFFSYLPGSDTPYPLIPVDDINSSIQRKNKKYYTFKQVFEEMQNSLFPTPEEARKEKEEHIKPSNKFTYRNSRCLITAYNNSKELYDVIYRELRTSDFQNFIKSSGKSPNSVKQLVQLYKHMDKYAFQEDIIDKCYAQHIKKTPISNTSKRTPFTYDQIEYLWNIEPENQKEELVRDILLLANYTGCRAEELLFLYTHNIYFDKDYFIGGLKTENGINREIPIHPRIKPILRKYYNSKNEFLFMKQNGKRVFYSTYQFYYSDFIKKHDFIKGKTAHCGRHGLETELQRLNVKPQIINSILGHKNGDTGNDIYNHISIEEKIEAINMVTYKTGKIYVLKAEEKTS